MWRAQWHGVLLARSARTVSAAGQRWFPPDGVCWENLTEGSHRRWRPGRGRVRLLSVAIDDEVVADIAEEIVWPGLRTGWLRGHVAFSPPVTIDEQPIDKQRDGD